MFTKHTKSIALAVVTGLMPLVMTATPVFAATSTGQTTNMAAQTMQPGMNAATASGPINGWVQIAPHSAQWFKFKYSYDNSKKNKDDEDNAPTQALVKLTMKDPGSVSFKIWDAGRLQNPQYDNTDIHHRHGMVEPVGVGTPMFEYETHHRDANGARETVDVTNPDVLVWQGSQRATDTFYIVVKNKTDAPASYSLSVSGPDVSY
jgi:hypothetical protein